MLASLDTVILATQQIDGEEHQGYPTEKTAGGEEAADEKVQFVCMAFQISLCYENCKHCH